MVVLGPTCDVIVRDHIRMAVPGTTYDGTSGDNMRYQFWRPHVVSVLGATSYTGVKLKSPPGSWNVTCLFHTAEEQIGFMCLWWEVQNCWYCKLNVYYSVLNNFFFQRRKNVDVEDKVITPRKTLWIFPIMDLELNEVLYPRMLAMIQVSLKLCVKVGDKTQTHKTVRPATFSHRYQNCTKVLVKLNEICY
jgi:hypothetical protein